MINTLDYDSIIWVFDFDNTLIESTKNRLELLEQETIELGIIQDIKKNMDFYKRLKSNGLTTAIITARHPQFKKNIIQYTDNLNVYCRDFNLDKKEIERSYTQIEYKHDALQKMIEFKARILNDLAKDYLFVFFMDDYAQEFKYQSHLLVDKVYIIPPFHLYDGGYSIKGAIEHHKSLGLF